MDGQDRRFLLLRLAQMPANTALLLYPILPLSNVDRFSFLLSVKVDRVLENGNIVSKMLFLFAFRKT